MFPSIRLLPVTIIAATLLFGLKIGALWQGAGTVWLGASPAIAKEHEKAAGENKPRDLAAEQQAEQEAAKTKAAADAVAAAEAEAAAKPKRRDVLSEQDPSLFSGTELGLLENLVERRKELEARATEFEVRENLLAATEKRIDGKIAELKQIEDTIRGLLREHDKREEQQLRRLVKVYENMKAKDAARIFDQLDLEILLDVAERMREAKMAPILANMSSEKANALTVEMATRRRMPEVDEALGAASGGSTAN